ncbi:MULTISPECIES: AraC family transcriptional regulator [unclassified Brenneria]|uniref:AraC family transcriptional regulator n=1 Tax=unclassified Brenneria TaxID=2634434 RepID=UPI0018F05FF7|nr:AraC family transcriptional regulator [Brenneria sp. L3-3C-1]MBJ7221268.1 AraC family transcriptional regulator [Brenneria sp. L3-3C-1]MEE3642512.1 AraC family transcriptional regulator [Brenneria sp. L3_3C_1]
MKEIFTTDNLDNRHRFDAWRDAVCSRLIRAQARQTFASEFSGSFTYSMLADVGIASHTSSSSLLWQRTTECIRRHPSNDYYLGYFRSGKGSLEQNGNAAKVGPDELVIYDAAHPFNFSMDKAAIHIVRLPRAVFDKNTPKIAALAGTCLNPVRPGITTLKQMMQEAFAYNQEQENSFYTEQFAGTLLDIITVCINLQQGGEIQKPDLYNRMVKYLKQNLHKHDLSITTIANAHHVSPRTVTRVFAAHNTTPMNTLWHERLIACHKALTAGNIRNITEVALDHGFIDMSHFSLAFRKAFGYSPSSLLPKNRVTSC